MACIVKRESVRSGQMSYFVKYRDADKNQFSKTFYNPMEAHAFWESVNLKYPKIYQIASPEVIARREERKRLGWKNGRPPCEFHPWERKAPNLRICSICGKLLESSCVDGVIKIEGVTEERHTAWDIKRREPKKQKWAYCTPCWERHQVICEIPINLPLLIGV